jgi:Zn-dependent oligopeptidase
MRLDVFQAKLNAEKNIKKSGEWDKLSSEEKRLVDKMILDGKRDGLALPEKERNELMALKKVLSQTCLEFSVGTIIVSSVTCLLTRLTEKFQRRECALFCVLY